MIGKTLAALVLIGVVVMTAGSIVDTMPPPAEVEDHPFVTKIQELLVELERGRIREEEFRSLHDEAVQDAILAACTCGLQLDTEIYRHEDRCEWHQFYKERGGQKWHVEAVEVFFPRRIHSSSAPATKEGRVALAKAKLEEYRLRRSGQDR